MFKGLLISSDYTWILNTNSCRDREHPPTASSIFYITHMQLHAGKKHTYSCSYKVWQVTTKQSAEYLFCLKQFHFPRLSQVQFPGPSLGTTSGEGASAVGLSLYHDHLLPGLGGESRKFSRPADGLHRGPGIGV